MSSNHQIYIEFLMIIYFSSLSENFSNYKLDDTYPILLHEFKTKNHYKCGISIKKKVTRPILQSSPSIRIYILYRIITRI